MSNVITYASSELTKTIFCSRSGWVTTRTEKQANLTQNATSRLVDPSLRRVRVQVKKGDESTVLNPDLRMMKKQDTAFPTSKSQMQTGRKPPLNVCSHM